MTVPATALSLTGDGPQSRASAGELLSFASGDDFARWERRSRSMLSNPRMSFRAASGNDVHSSVSGTFVSAVIWGGCPRRPRRLPSPRVACSQPLGPLDKPKQALPADNRRIFTRLRNDPCTVTNRLSQYGQTSSDRWPTWSSTTLIS